jgi:hypothetical protein
VREECFVGTLKACLLVFPKLGSLCRHTGGKKKLAERSTPKPKEAKRKVLSASCVHAEWSLLTTCFVRPQDLITEHFRVFQIESPGEEAVEPSKSATKRRRSSARATLKPKYTEESDGDEEEQEAEGEEPEPQNDSDYSASE